MQTLDQHGKYMAHLPTREIEKWMEPQVREGNLSFFESSGYDCIDLVPWGDLEQGNLLSFYLRYERVHHLDNLHQDWSMTQNHLSMVHQKNWWMHFGLKSIVLHFFMDYYLNQSCIIDPDLICPKEIHSEWLVPDCQGNLTDVLQGFDSGPDTAQIDQLWGWFYLPGLTI